MGNIWRKPTIEYALAQVNKKCGKTNPYSAEMDSIGYYNYPKNGVANSCSIFVDRCVYEGAGHDKYDTLYATCEPQGKGANAGAGCVQAVGYFRNANRYTRKASEASVGDKLFYASSQYVSADNPEGLYHTGIVVDWGSYPEGQGFKVVEGNTDGGYVRLKFVSFSDPRIHGFGLIRYDGDSPEESSEPSKPSEPEEKKSDSLIVTTKVDPLTIRSAPSTGSMALGSIPKGTELKTNTFCNGDFVHGDNTWFKVTYNGVTGYVAGYYLTRS